MLHKGYSAHVRKSSVCWSEERSGEQHERGQSIQRAYLELPKQLSKPNLYVVLKRHRRNSLVLGHTQENFTHIIGELESDGITVTEAATVVVEFG